MRLTLAMLRLPPGWALFKVKSRAYLEVLTLAFLCIDDVGVEQLPHTYSFDCILLGDKTKQQGP